MNTYPVEIIANYDVLIDDTKAKRICKDCTRLVYRIGSNVIKIETDDDGWRNRFHQCRSEYRKWTKKISVSDRKYFVPILEYKHLDMYDYVIEPFIKMKKGRASEQIESKIYELCDKYNINDIIKGIQCNWSISAETGLPVLFDYGL
jgi:hypothetical protein